MMEISLERLRSFLGDLPPEFVKDPLNEVTSIKVAMHTVVEKFDAVTKRMYERVTVEDDGTKTVETFPENNNGTN